MEVKNITDINLSDFKISRDRGSGPMVTISNKLLTMKVGQVLILSKEDWPLKSHPGILKTYKPLKGILEISVMSAKDGESWAIVLKKKTKH